MKNAKQIWWMEAVFMRQKASYKSGYMGGKYTI